jgi:hypothetical protein
MEKLIDLLPALIPMALISTSLVWRIYDYVVRGIVCFRPVRYAEGDARPAQRSAHTTQERIISSHV